MSQQILAPLNAVALSIAKKLPSTPPKPTRRKNPLRARGQNRGIPNVSHTDEQVAHLKYLMMHGWGYAEIQRVFGLEYEYAYRLDMGIRRGGILPQRHPNPESIFPQLRRD